MPVPEGVRIVECPFCEGRSLVQGERGVRRWQMVHQVDREQALTAVTGFFSGINKAFGLKRQAKVRELFLVYLPYWRASAFVAGWIFGRVSAGEDKTKPVEVEVSEDMSWNDAAADVSEFGVHRVPISPHHLAPYDPDWLHERAMVFEPSESPTEALSEAERHFVYRARSRKKLKARYSQTFHLLRPQLSLVYYPLWVARYEYRQRNYQVVVDGVRGRVLYGKAPGNVFYRAAMLVLGMALGNLILINGTALATRLLAEDSDEGGLALLLVPIAVGIGLIVAAYRTFRYGEEVEEIQKEAKKAALSEADESKSWWRGGFDAVKNVTEMLE